MQGQTLKERRSSRKKASPHSTVCLYQRRRHLELWRRQNEISAFALLSWRHSRDVPSGFAPFTTPRSRMLEKDAGFFRVISTTSLWDLRLWRQWGEGMWACVRIESNRVNVFSHRTYYNALFNVFFPQVSSPGEGSETHGPKPAISGSITDRPGAIRWRLTPRVQSFDSEWKPCVYRVQPLCAGAV